MSDDSASLVGMKNMIRCCAEVEDRVRRRSLPKGRLAWKTCGRVAKVFGRGRFGGLLEYCAAHAKRLEASR